LKRISRAMGKGVHCSNVRQKAFEAILTSGKGGKKL
jgi:hypothetical protein